MVSGDVGGIRTNRNSSDCSTNGFDVIEARAVIVLGDYAVSTPDILSINVTRSRGEIPSKASVSFYINEFNIGTGANIGLFIKIGSIPVFTGYLRKFTVSPSFRWAGELIVKASGEDVLYRLLNKRVVRRQKQEGLGPLALITGLTKRSYPGFDNPSLKFDVDRGASPVGMVTPGFHEQIGTMLREASFSFGPTQFVTKNADPLRNVSPAGTGGGLTLHDHSTLDLGSSPHAGGPSRSVFGIK